MTFEKESPKVSIRETRRTLSPKRTGVFYIPVLIKGGGRNGNKLAGWVARRKRPKNHRVPST